MGEPVDDFMGAIAALKREQGLTPSQRLCDAIRRGETIDANLALDVGGLATLDPKREAVLAGRRDVLKMMLEQDNTMSEELVATACERYDRDAVALLLRFGWSIDHPVCSMASLLCCSTENVEFMQWLVDHGADVNARSSLDESALSIAIVHGSMDTVHLLLAKGTDLTHGNLLHCAAERNDEKQGADLAEHLMKNGANPNAHRYNNPIALKIRGMSALLTPLHVACNNRNAPVVSTLLQHGANPNLPMFQEGRLSGPTPLETAQSINDQDLLDLLISATKTVGGVVGESMGSEASFQTSTHLGTNPDGS